jgi:4-amino-4-deoxy-L-arabinose transferase-like glycosyltransferase
MTSSALSGQSSVDSDRVADGTTLGVFRAFPLFEVCASALLAMAAAAPFAPAVGRLLAARGTSGAVQHSLIAAALLCAIGWCVHATLTRHTPIRDGAQVVFRLSTMAIIGLVACLAVTLWQYLAWIIPDTWSTEVIYVLATQPHSLIGLYSIDRLQQPTIVTPIYPPLYIAIARAGFAAFGRSPETLRIITTMGIIAIAAGLLTASSRGHRDRWALLAPAVFLAFFTSVTWSGAPTKPEYLACAFAIWSLAVYSRWGLSDDTKWIVPCGLLFGAALLIKYTIVGGLIGVLGHLLLRRKFRSAAVLAGIVAGLVGSVYVGLSIATHGGLITFTVNANAVHLQLGKVWNFGLLSILNRPFGVLIVTAGVGLAARLRNTVGPEVAVAIALAVSVPFALLALGKPGSSANYFLEPVALGALAVAFALRGAIHERGPNQGVPADAFPVAALLAAAIIQIPWSLNLMALGWIPPNRDREITRSLASLQVAPDQFVMADVNYVYAVSKAGLKPVMVDNHVYTLLSENGVIDAEPLLTLFRSGKVPYLVLRGSLEWESGMPYGDRLYPPRVLAYLMRNYRCEPPVFGEPGAQLVVCRQTTPGTEARSREEH